MEKAHGQIDELARTLERERATAAARHAELAAEMSAVQKASAKVEAIAKQQKEEADMTLESMRAALTMQMEAAETAQAEKKRLAETDASRDSPETVAALAAARSDASEAAARAETSAKECDALRSKLEALEADAATAAEVRRAAEEKAEWNAKKLKKQLKRAKRSHEA